MPKARAKNGFNIMIVHFYIRIKLDIIWLYDTRFFSLVLIQRILIGFEALMEMLDGFLCLIDYLVK